MLRNSLDDPSVTVNRSFLRACASVSRQSVENPGEYRGLLFFEPQIGASLVLELEGRKRLRTTPIVRIEPVSDDTLCIDTENNRYLVRRLFQVGGVR